jgi:hypothetical protein
VVSAAILNKISSCLEYLSHLRNINISKKYLQYVSLVNTYYKYFNIDSKNTYSMCSLVNSSNKVY